MHKLYIFFCISALCLLASCNSGKFQENRIMVTIEPQRFFAEQLAEPFFTIETMIPNNSSPETYDPTPKQMTDIAGCKAYWAIGYLGFELHWLQRIQMNNPNITFFRTSDHIEPIITLTHHGDHRHENMDPHIWTSPKALVIMAENIYESLIYLDQNNKDTYAENLEKVKTYLNGIDEKIREELANSSQKAFMIYHPTLSYFARDYGLKQYSIENEGKEPTPEMLKKMIQAAKEENIRTIFIQEEFDKKNAETIAKETGANMVVINPLSYNWEEEMIKIVQALSNE